MRINGNWNKSGSSASRLHHPADIVSGCPAMHAQPQIHPRTRAGRPGEGVQWFQRPLGSGKSQKDPEKFGHEPCLSRGCAWIAGVLSFKDYAVRSAVWQCNASGRLSRFSNINLNESMENGRSIVIGETFSANKYISRCLAHFKRRNQHCWPTI